MSANRFQQNKETLLFIGVGTGLIILFIINYIVIAPAVISVYSPIPLINRSNAIDTQTVNQAVGIINGIDKTE